MKKIKLLLAVMLLLFTQFVHAQQWYFGFKAGIDFSSGPPVAITTGLTNTNEGCAVANDASGNMLFYTDGTSVWNKNNMLMTDGTNPITGINGLVGNRSATQTAIIVPKPNRTGSSSYACDTFFIFTVPAGDGEVLGQPNCSGYLGSFCSANFKRGFCYSIVVFNSLHPTGYIPLKNVLLKNNVAEKLTSIDAGNNTYWVIVHGYDARVTGDNNAPGANEDKTFYCYSLTASGINLVPVQSTVGSPQISLTADNYENAPGQMKISPDGKMLAVAVFKDRFVELFDFNNTNGLITNPKRINFLPSPAGAIYGIEFSPNSHQLFIGQTDGQSNIYQIDLASLPTSLSSYPLSIPSPLLPLTTMKSIASSLYPGYDFGSLQTGPDGHIYVARSFRLSPNPDIFRLSQIPNPNAYSVQTNFIDNIVNLNTMNCGLSLPSVTTCGCTESSACKHTLSSMSLTAGNITSTPTNSLQSIQLNFTNLITLQELQISIVDISYSWVNNGCKNCKANAIGSSCLYPASATQTIGGLAWDNIHNIGLPPSANPMQCLGELVWNSGVALTAGSYSVPMNLSLPILTVPGCCNLHIDKLCLRVTYKDVNCNSCNTLICLRE
jgi:hypothetical protein